jgi:prolyl-tRNA editing enzyme YbaK/EbsC (Cys-tRNA(Pro) deacylase)
VETARHYMEKAQTTTGFMVAVRILTKAYQTGRTCAKAFKKTMKIVFDEALPKWNYTAVPEHA